MHPEIAKTLKRPKVKIIGVGEASKIQSGGVGLDLTYSGGRDSGNAQDSDRRENDNATRT